MESSLKKTIKHHRICFVAGRSGGHILPCITLAQQIMNKHPDYEVVFFSTTGTLDQQLLHNNPIIKTYIPLKCDPFPYKHWYKIPIFFYNFVSAFFKSLVQLYRLNPETVMSTGGYISVPVCLAATCLKIPIELYELNVIPGKTIKILSWIAQKIWVCFEESTKHLPANKCSLTNYPIKFIDKTKILTRSQALTSIGFSDARQTILVLGGSQGSLFINAIMRNLLEQNAAYYSKIQILHQTGALDSTNWHNFYKQLTIPAIVFSYSDAIGTYYAAADLILCRSGAGTLAEIMFFNKQCITIPLETKTTMHQVDNALAATSKYPQLISMIRQKDIEKDYHIIETAIQQKLNL